MQNVYELNLNNGGAKLNVKLRLSLGAQIQLKKKFKQNTFPTILDAMDDVEKCAEVLTEALNFKGNENEVKDGADLYDLLVDNGYAGYEGIGELLLAVAVCSGIITERTKQKVLAGLMRTLDSMFDGLVEEEEEEDEDEPEKN